MSITTQYLDATRKVQDSWFAAFDAAAGQATRGFEAPKPAVVAEPRKVVTNWFDFAEKALRVQRETALRIVSANDEVASQWRAQATQLQGMWTEQVKVATDTFREQSETFAAAGREQAQQYGEAFESKAREVASATTAQARKVTEAGTENVRRAAEKGAKATTEAAEKGAKAAEKGAEATTEAAKRTYTLMNSAQLKAELTARDLPTSGTLDEMRTRLRENDAKA